MKILGIGGLGGLLKLGFGIPDGMIHAKLVNTGHTPIVHSFMSLKHMREKWYPQTHMAGSIFLIKIRFVIETMRMFSHNKRRERERRAEGHNKQFYIIKRNHLTLRLHVKILHIRIICLGVFGRRSLRCKEFCYLF